MNAYNFSEGQQATGRRTAVKHEICSNYKYRRGFFLLDPLCHRNAIHWDFRSFTERVRKFMRNLVLIKLYPLLYTNVTNKTSILQSFERWKIFCDINVRTFLWDHKRCDAFSQLIASTCRKHLDISLIFFTTAVNRCEIVFMMEVREEISAFLSYQFNYKYKYSLWSCVLHT